MGRFSQAISEGDGISIVPVLEGDVAELAVLAEDAGAEAVAVRGRSDVETARSHTSLPVLMLTFELEAAASVAPVADACVVPFERFSDDGALEGAQGTVLQHGLDCLIEVRDDEELEEALERVDPEIVLISERHAEDDEEDLERTLDLLPSVPAGKLVVSESRVNVREQVIALERAGVDAVLVRDEVFRAADFSAALAELTGR
jgi:indole-3-glycerol phosphate synthase